MMKDGECMKLKGAIFDMDGTLIDSMPVWDGMGSEFLRQKGCIPEAGLDAKIGEMSMSQSAEYFIKNYRLGESVDEIIDQLNNRIAWHYRVSIPLKPGVERFLERLRKSRVKMCVATATDISLASPALKRLGIIDYFEDIITCNQLGIAKDDPAFFLETLKRIDTPIAETMVFEDALYAIKSAKAAGFTVAGVYDSSMEADSKKIASLADIYLNSYDEWEME
ncbi:MAG TPA: hypothetical protein DD738_02045 [Ruminiclostridium sp.]|nr:hypothetical protein [Ruminiclostridium sp.]